MFVEFCIELSAKHPGPEDCSSIPEADVPLVLKKGPLSDFNIRNLLLGFFVSCAQSLDLSLVYERYLRISCLHLAC